MLVIEGINSSLLQEVNDHLFPKNHKNFFIITAFAAFLIIVIVLLSMFWPRNEMNFIEMGLLGEHKMASGYFPNEDNILSADSEIKWFIYLHNHLETTQKVIVRVKLVNSTMDIPDDQKHLPSSQIFLIELPSSLSIDETTLLPFSWSVLEATSQEDSINLRRIMINDQAIEVNVSDSINSFRLIFELWVYNSSSQEYEFGWESEKGLSSSSIYMTFSLAQIFG